MTTTHERGGAICRFTSQGARSLTLVLLLASAACSASNGEVADAGPSAPVDAGPAVDREPPAGPPQYTFMLDSFEVPAGAELYKCQDVPNPFGEDVAIVETESDMSMGGHHMYGFQIPAAEAAFALDAGIYSAEVPPVMPEGGIVQTFAPDGGKTPVFDCPAGGLEFHPYFHLTQRAHDTITYPEGIGRSLKSSEAIRLSIHYLNAGTAPLQVSATITVHYVKPNAVKQLAAGVFVYAESINVPTGMSTQSFSYPVPQDMSFLQVTGHMHRRGLHYEAHAISATGEVRPMYSSDTWNEPATLNFATPFKVNEGDTIGYSCTYDNETGAALTYGESAATNEMCNLFGVFYPAANGAGLLHAL